jgi:hypothetical protein
MPFRHYLVEQDADGFSIQPVTLGVMAGLPESKHFADAAGLRAELLKLEHTASQIEFMMLQLSKSGSVVSKVLQT